MFTNDTTLIIPTRNRYKLLLRILRQIFKLNIKFNEIIIIDSSEKKEKKLIKELKKKYKINLYFSKPSSSLQRNIGLKKMNLKNKFVMFLDDDVFFLKNAFKEMEKIVKKYRYDDEIVGFCFNQIERRKVSLFEKLKTSKLLKKINLYSDLPGKVTNSGWHTKILNVREDILADWVFTTASIYKTKMIKNKFFTNLFGQYSYLEDLDFSLNATRLKKYFILSSKAKFKHPYNIDRSGFIFGKVEIFNRYKIIKKYRLNMFLFLINVFLRFLISFSKILILNFNSFKRALGNILALIVILFEQK